MIYYYNYFSIGINQKECVDFIFKKNTRTGGSMAKCLTLLKLAVGYIFCCPFQYPWRFHHLKWNNALGPTLICREQLPPPPHQGGGPQRRHNHFLRRSRRPPCCCLPGEELETRSRGSGARSGGRRSESSAPRESKRAGVRTGWVKGCFFPRFIQTGRWDSWPGMGAKIRGPLANRFAGSLLGKGWGGRTTWLQREACVPRPVWGLRPPSPSPFRVARPPLEWL